MTAGTPLPAAPEAARTRDHALVWIDARTATLVRRHDEAVTIEHLESDVPAHRKSTGQVRHEPGIRHGGGGSPQTAGEPHRTEHLRRWVATVLARLPMDDDLTIVGPGTVHEQLERAVRQDDRHHRRERTVRAAASGPRTDRQLVAQLSREAGVEPRRRTVGAYRWSERPVAARSGRHGTGPQRVTEKTGRSRPEPPQAPER